MNQLPDRLFAVRISEFEAAERDDILMSTYKRAVVAADSINRNQQGGTIRTYIGLTYEGAVQKAIKGETSGYDVDNLLYAKIAYSQFNPHTDSVPTGMMTSGKSLLRRVGW